MTTSHLRVPLAAAASKQKLWDGVRAASVAERSLECAENDEERARLLSVSTKESGAWFQSLNGIMIVHSMQA